MTGTTVWARDYLQQVAEARRALERAEEIHRRQREAMFSLPSGLTVSGAHSGRASDGMARVDTVLDSETQDDGLAWARTTLEGFRAVLVNLRSSCRGTLLEATYAAEYRYALGFTEQQTAAALDLAKSTVRRYVATLVDYLDHIGPAIVPGGILQPKVFGICSESCSESDLIAKRPTRITR